MVQHTKSSAAAKADRHHSQRRGARSAREAGEGTEVQPVAGHRGARDGGADPSTRGGVTRRDRLIDGRIYYDTTGRCWPASRECEHCDGECGPWVRCDDLRGLICPTCDSALDEMFDEAPGSSLEKPVAEGEKR